MTAGDFVSIELINSVIDMDELLDRRRDEAQLLYASLESTITNPLDDVHAVTCSALQTDDNVLITAPGTGGGVTTVDDQDIIGSPVIADNIDVPNKPFVKGRMEVSGPDIWDPLFHARDEVFIAHGIWVGNNSATDAVHRLHAGGKLVFGVHSTS